MRTTLDIDDRVLAAARVLASQEVIPLGAAVSELARRGLGSAPSSRRSGFPVLHPADPQRIITNDLVERYRDDA
jgi:hypothetical protein